MGPLVIAFIEISIGIIIYFNKTRLYGLVASIVLSIVFFIINTLPSQFYYDLNRSCGCLGPQLNVDAVTKRLIAAVLLLITFISLKGSSRNHE